MYMNKERLNYWHDLLPFFSRCPEAELQALLRAIIYGNETYNPKHNTNSAIKKHRRKLTSSDSDCLAGALCVKRKNIWIW